jgi:hypothetical protein
MNIVPNRPGIVVMEEVMSDREDERTEEAQRLCSMISDEDNASLTTWELQTVTDVRDGKAATRVRLRELRAIVKRLAQNK